ncbi:MAG: hypothetical protein JXQ73_21560 [Phycisphaerae bacterium]|nr:hypothetical protein [Phycisphaerae bacterium]
MSKSDEIHDPQTGEDDVTLYAFEELASERLSEVEAAVERDDGAREIAEAMRRLARLGGEDESGPGGGLLATTRVTMEVALERRRRRRQVRRFAAAGSIAAAAAVVLAFTLSHKSSPEAPKGIEKAQLAVSQPARRGLNDEDRARLRRSVARMRYDWSWDDSLDRDVAEAKERLEAVEYSSCRSDWAPRRYRMLRGQIEHVSRELDRPPRTTRPAGSSRGPASMKEANNA